MSEQSEKFDGWAWPDWSYHPGRAAQSTRDRIAGVVWPGVFLLYLLQPISDVLDGHHSGIAVFGVVATSVLFAIAYIAVAWFAPRGSKPVKVAMIALLSVFPILLALQLGPSALVFFTYAISPALMFLPANVGGIYGLAATASLLISSKVVEGSPEWGNAMVLAILTIAMMAFGGLIRTVKILRATQDRMAKLAVAEERSRLARDLHDVLGHSLTTITVKAGLARRVLESHAPLEQAIAEVRDVEELARQAMSEVRATVSGYRTATLPAELVGARAALAAAGIAADLPQAVDNVIAGLQETFAYVLREGVTNVIRHSDASRCEVRLGDTWLEVRDNGRCGAGKVGVSLASGGGHGLSGLAERVSKIDGELSAGPLPEGGFLLRVSVKAPAQAAPEAAQQAGGVVARPSVGLA